MKILHLLAGGNTGGIEILLKNIIINSYLDNRVCFLFKKGEVYDFLKLKSNNILDVTKKGIREKIHIIYNYCKKEKIDVIILHHEGLKNNLIYIKLKKKLKNNQIKFIRYMHCCYDEYYNMKYKNKILKAIYKYSVYKTISTSDIIIYISKAVKRSFELNFNINVKSVVIYNGIPDNFYGKVKKKFNDNKIKISYVGRIAKVKGIDIFIDSINDVYKKYKDLEVTVVGDGPERENLEKKVNELRLEKIIKFIGVQDDVIPILDKSDIFIYPSICDEGFGISVIEAMARECIPITFNKGALPEIISNGINGLLVDTLSSKELAKAIYSIILMDYEKRNNMEKEAIKRAKEFSLNKTIKKLENVISSEIK